MSVMPHREVISHPKQINKWSLASVEILRVGISTDPDFRFAINWASFDASGKDQFRLWL
jgi:hypothetical protein